MSASGIILVNGKDLADFGVVAARVEGPMDGLKASYQTTQAPDRDGEILLNPTPRTEKRTLLLLARFEATSQSTLNAQVRKLKGYLSRGLLQIQSGHDLSVVYYGHLTSPPVRVLDPQLVERWAEISFEFSCYDPYPQALNGGVVQIIDTPTPIPMGHALVLGDLYIYGPTTSAVIKVFSANGHLMKSISLAQNLTSGQVIRFRNLDGVVERLSSGVWVEAYDWLPDTYDFPFHLDHRWGDVDMAAYAMLAISGLGSGAEGEFRYKMAHN